MKVLHNNGETIDFKPRIIKESILNETTLTEKEAENIKNSVVKTIKENYTQEISTNTIRTLINAQLIKRGKTNEEEKTKVYGPSGKEINNLINKGCKDNANIGYSPEMVAKYIYDSTMKQYALDNMPKECSDAHKNCYIHVHDLEYYMTRPNCMNYDLRFFARNGLMIDGKGLMGSTASPAKSLEVLLNHMLQAWMSGAVVFSGGQGYTNFNTFLAPFCKNKSYEEIKQAIQGFIYNCNMSLICRGGQCLFSSIALDLSIPDFLLDAPAVSYGGVIRGTYKDYQEEADLIFRAVCEVSNEKDSSGAYHRFPNILFNIREGDLDEYKGTCKLLHETGANNPTIYYNNCIHLERSTMGCRSSLPMNYKETYELDCVNTGNFMYNTINLPLIALESNNTEEFYKKLDKICEICYTSLIHRRNVIKDVLYNKHMSDFLLQTDKDTGLPLYDLDRTTITLGYCGLYECLQSLPELVGVEVISFINKKKDEFYNRDGLRWSVIASPAESTSHRFAEYNVKKHPETAVVQGKEGSYYLTNSHHIPVSEMNSLIDHIRNAGKYHGLSKGGAILHIWLNEVWSDPEALWKFNKRIIEEDIIFWAYSKAFTHCQECSYTINDKLSVCPICNSTDLRVYDRITGYYLCVDTFNDGKFNEFNERFRHGLRI